MAFVSAQKSRIIVDTFHLSTVSQKVDTSVQAAMLDATVFTSPAKEYLAGIASSNLSVSGLLDTLGSSGLLTLLDGWKSAEKPVTIALEGMAVGNAVIMSSATESQFKTGATADGIAAFDLTADTNGVLDFGNSLHDLAAETDTADGTAVDGTAASANGGVAHLHVVGALTTVSAVTFKVQHSVNGTTGWADLATFTAATGATSERVLVAAGTAVRQYTRASWTATGGPGSFTFQLSFARH